MARLRTNSAFQRLTAAYASNEMGVTIAYILIPLVILDLTGSAAPTELETVLDWNSDCILVTGKGMSDLTAKDILAGSAGGVDFTQLKAYENKAVCSTGLGMWNWFTPNPDASLAAYWVGWLNIPERGEYEFVPEHSWASVRSTPTMPASFS